MILGSSLPKIFSAGLEITEMYQPDEARLREFWRMLQALYLQLYGSNMVTMAAITVILHDALHDARENNCLSELPVFKKQIGLLVFSSMVVGPIQVSRQLVRQVTSYSYAL